MSYNINWDSYDWDDDSLEFLPVSWSDIKNVLKFNRSTFSRKIDLRLLRRHFKRITENIKLYSSIDEANLSEEDIDLLDRIELVFEQRRFYHYHKEPFLYEDINGKLDINDSNSFILYILRFIQREDPNIIVSHIVKMMFEIYTYLICCNEAKYEFDYYLFMINSIRYKSEYTDYIKDLRYYTFNEAYGAVLDLSEEYISKVEELYSKKLYPPMSKTWGYDIIPRESYCINFYNSRNSDFEYFFKEEVVDYEYLEKFEQSLKYLLLRYGCSFSEPKDNDKLTWVTGSLSFRSIYDRKLSPLKYIFREEGIPSFYTKEYVFLVKDVPISPGNVRTISINDYLTRFSLKRLSFILAQVIEKLPMHVRKKHINYKEYDSILNDPKAYYFESDIKKSGITFPSSLIRSTAKVFKEVYPNSDINEYIEAFMSKKLIWKNTIYTSSRGFGLGNSNELETLIHIAVANLTGLKYYICNDDVCYNLGTSSNIDVYRDYPKDIINIYSKLGFIMNYKKIYLGKNHRFCERYYIYNYKLEIFKLCDKYQLIYHILSDICLAGTISYAKLLFRSFDQKHGFYCGKLCMNLIELCNRLYKREFAFDEFCPYKLGGWGYMERYSTLSNDLRCVELQHIYEIDFNEIMLQGYSLEIDTQILLQNDYEYNEAYEYLNFYMPNMISPKYMLRGDLINESIKNKLFGIKSSRKMIRKLNRIQRKRDNLYKRYPNVYSRPININIFVDRYGIEGECLAPCKLFDFFLDQSEKFEIRKCWGFKMRKINPQYTYETLSKLDYSQYKRFDLRNDGFSTIFGYHIFPNMVINYYKSTIREIVNLDQLYDLALRKGKVIDCIYNVVEDIHYIDQYKRSRFNSPIKLKKLPRSPNLRYSAQLIDYIDYMSKEFPNILIEQETPTPIVEGNISVTFKEYLDNQSFEEGIIYALRKPITKESYNNLMLELKLEQERIREKIERAQFSEDFDSFDDDVETIEMDGEVIEIQPQKSEDSLLSDDFSIQSDLDDSLDNEFDSLDDIDLDDPDMFV